MQSIFDRRTFVGATSAFAVAAGAKAVALPTYSDILVTVKLPEGEYRFHSATGKDLGNYTGPNFVQQNIVVRDRSIPFTVFFRPDVTSDRLEIVFEWGDPFLSSARDLDAYTAEISHGGNTIAKIDVPGHYWLSRWRWQSKPRPFVKTAEDVFAAKIFPRYRRIAGRQSLPPPATPYTIMGFSGINKYMPTTGERGDIGPLPEYYAAYLATGDETMKASMLTWAECAASFPWHLRDAANWAPINWNKYPKATTYFDQGGASPVIYRNPRGVNVYERPYIDDAHEPALTFLPFILTGDLFFLEELQFMATYLLHSDKMFPGLFNQLQTRGWAWSLRTIVDVVCATPEHTPAFLLPKSYWQVFLDKNLKSIMHDHVNATDVKNRVFSSGTEKSEIGFWQEDYLATVLGMVVYRGFKAWRPVFEWKVRSDIARTNGTSGWPRSVPTAYFPSAINAVVRAGKNAGNGWVDVGRGNFKAKVGDWSVKFTDSRNFTVLQPNRQIHGHGTVDKLYNSHALSEFTFTVHAGTIPFAAGDSFTISVELAENWTELAKANNYENTPDGSLKKGMAADYPQTVRAALVMGVINGVTDAAPCLEWLNPELLSSSYNLSWRWSIVPNANP
jgi:hypothetical protein